MKNNTRVFYLNILVFSLLVILRLIPSYLSSTLFSTDVWPLYRSTFRLVVDPSVRIWDDSVFDGYNNHWPGVILSTTVYSVVTHVKPIYTYMYVFSIVLAIGYMLGFYMVSRIFLPSKYSLAALFIFAGMPSFLVFTISPLKEVYAYTLFFSIIYFFIRALKGDEINLPRFITIVLLAMGIVLSHHLATYMLLGIMFSTLYVYVIYIIKNDQSLSISGSMHRCLLVPLILTCLFVLYYILYGSIGLYLKISINESVLLIIYGVSIYGGYIVFSTKESRFARVLVLLPPLAFVGFLLFSSNMIGLLPGINVYTNMICWYVLPVLFGLNSLLYRIENPLLRGLIVGSLLFILLNTVYVVIGAPLYSSIFHRFANYLVIIIALSFGYITQKRTRLISIYGFLLVLLVFLSSTIVLFNIVMHRGDVSFFWYYTGCETCGFNTIALFNEGKTIVGDDKIKYYYAMEDDVVETPLLKLIYLGESLSKDYLLILYYDNLHTGLSIGLNTIKINKLLSYNVFSKIYDNSCVLTLIQ